MKQSIYRGIAMVAGVLVLVAVGLFFYHNQQQDRVSAAFVRENLVRNIDKNSVNNKYTMTFVKPTTVKVDDQRANNLTFNINFVIPKIGHHFFVFRDQDSDDGYNFEIEITPATHRIILSYWEANLDDPGRPQAEASFKSEYHFSQLSNKIRLIRTKFNFPKGFSVAEAQRIKQTQKMDERALRQLLTTQFKPVFLAALENYLSRHLPGWSNPASRSDKAHAKSVKQQNHTVKS